jgi:hypothetical protein
MSGIRSITRRPTVPGYATAGSAPIRVDDSTNQLKIVSAGSGTTEAIVADSVNGFADANNTVKFLPNSAAKALTSGAAAILFTLQVAALDSQGGEIVFHVKCTDGTDVQEISGIATYGVVNKAGTLTGAFTYVSGNEAKAVSAGTLTLAFTFVDGTGGLGQFKLAATTSLTPTILQVEYTVFPIRGVVTIL